MQKDETLDQLSDGELLTSFQLGNARAFSVLYKRRHLELYRFILRFVHGDEAVASDLFQETFIKIHENAATLRDEQNIRSWMYAIARNNCLNHIKRQRRQVPLSEQHLELMDTDIMPPDLQLHNETMHARLDRAIAELPDNQREAIILREYEGLSYAEIAEATHTNIGIVRQRLWRAKQSLRTMLTPFFDGDAPGDKEVEGHE